LLTLLPLQAKSPVGWVGAVVLSDWARTYVPFGGVPLGGIPLGQAGGPLAPAARLGGELAVTGVVAAAGVVLEMVAVAAARRWTQRAPAAGRRSGPDRPTGRPLSEPRRAGPRLVAPLAGTVMLCLAVVLGGTFSPPGRAVGPLRVAAVQGGGRRGLRAIYSSSQAVLDAAVAETATVQPPVDLVVWPEDVVAMDGPVAGTATDARIGRIAASLHATVLAGVTEDVGPDRFRNAEVAWGPDGRIIGRYDKVHRVPFGEYVPGRSIIAHLVNLDVIPREAIAGTGSGRLDTAGGPVGVAISFEVFFSARSRSAIKAGGQVLLIPTNTASYTTTQIPSSELAAARLRAWETGRDVVMAAPTGFTAIFDAQGHQRFRTRLGPPALLEATVTRRTGETPYVRYGDRPTVAGAALLVGLGWALARRSRGPSDGPDPTSALDRAVNTDQP